MLKKQRSSLESQYLKKLSDGDFDARLKEVYMSDNAVEAEKELGDLLFAIVNYARKLHIEPEVALDGTNNRFATRFAHVEQCVEPSDKEWADFTLAELDKFWDEAKSLEK